MKEQMQGYLTLVNDHLSRVCDRLLPARLPGPEGGLRECQVNQAARYSLLDGGKRIRGILVLAACELLGGDCRNALDFAAGVEMLHCYSLIHDDFRRGKPSCHKAFGEATALLAGDALQGAAFEAVAGAADKEGKSLPAQYVVEAAKALGLAGGARGMVLGQELDLAYEGKNISREILESIHTHKTGALINGAVQMGAAAAGGSREDREILSRFAFTLGLVFQIVDDVLDVTSTEQELGKPIGSDLEQGKTTYITLLGEQGAMELARKLTQESCQELAQAYGARADFLIWLAQSLLERRS